LVLLQEKHAQTLKTNNQLAHLAAVRQTNSPLSLSKNAWLLTNWHAACNWLRNSALGGLNLCLLTILKPIISVKKGVENKKVGLRGRFRHFILIEAVKDWPKALIDCLRFLKKKR
jgi:hypothetical protein